MKNKAIKIEGMGCCFSNGSNQEEIQETLKNNSSKAGLFQIPAYENLGPIPVFKAKTDQLNSYINKRNLRRIDHYTKMSLLSAFETMKDANLEAEGIEDLGLIISTGYGALNTNFKFLDSYIKFGDKAASPLAFSHSVHNSAAAFISINLKIKGPTLTITQFQNPFYCALQTAISWLETNKVKKVLVGSVDEYHPMIGFYYKKHFELKSGINFLANDKEQQAAFPGEGATFFLLGKDNNKHGEISISTESIKQYSPRNDPNVTFISNDNKYLKCEKQYKKTKGLKYYNYTQHYGSFPTNSALSLIFGLCDPEIKTPLIEQIQTDNNICNLIKILR